MFKEIFLFDLKRNFRKPQTYIFFGIFFILMLLLGLAAAGVFNVAAGDTNLVSNSAMAVAGVIVSLNSGILGLVNSVILVAVMATGIQKDYEYNTHPLYFTKPISKTGYFFGRFLSVLITALFVFSAQVIGYWIGSLFGMGTPFMGPFRLMNYLEPFLLFTLPNILLLGIIIFSITTFTRSTLSAYLFCIVLLVIRTITDNITADLDNKATAALWEPFGTEALQYLTQYWTPDEQNHRMIPLEGVLFHNRALWLGLALVITGFSFYRFRFSQFLSPISLFRKKEEAVSGQITLHSLSLLPKVQQRFSTAETWRQLFYLARFEFRKITRSTFFIIFSLLGIITMCMVARFMGAIYGTETYPVTYQILEMASPFFQLFILLMIVFLSGNVIWRERETKTDELIGVTPVSNTVLFFSKYLSLFYVTALLMLLMSLTGIMIQLTMGFYNIDPLQYLEKSLMLLVADMVVAGLCLSVQTVIPNKYLGFFLSLVPILFTNIIFNLLEWDFALYHFNSSGPNMPYSDMNGFGHTVKVWMLFKTYWMSIILILCLLALMLYARGKEKGWKARYRLSKGSIKAPYRIALFLLLACAAGTGGYIYYNTKVLNEYRTGKEQEARTAAFEKRYKSFEQVPQLRIVSTTADVDIYPHERSVHVKGYYYLKNKHALPVDTLYIDYPGGGKSYYHFEQLQPSVPATAIISDQEFGIRVFRLNKPVQPGDSIRFDFEVWYRPVGFTNDGTETDVVYNGTFFNNMTFPAIGYNPDAELGSNKARKKYGLLPKPRMAPVNDSLARMNTYISNDADWIRYETTVSTSEDQIAVAPGYLQQEWTKNGRRYFHYKMDSPILNFYAYLSAAYQVKRDKWKDVNIEIYYQKGHEYNLDRMIKGIKRSLDYYTANFGPYQHRQVRILEFPRYASFAQSFPNTIPFSESVGFIARVDEKDPEKIDVPFYITAHEVGHQWWAHQVIGGNVQGSVLMSETMSQYSALMVMEKEYGKQAMKKFLRYEMDKYLLGRTFEAKKEVPLMLCENQDYIHYNKGSVIMYALRDYLGEDVLNGAIRAYLERYKFQEPPYTNSIEFVNYLRAATPDSLKYIIRDMFETITLYENYVKDLSYTRQADGRYLVSLTVGSAKFRADSLGKNTKVPVSDYMDVGIFGAGATKGDKTGKELLLQRIKMDRPEKTFTFIVNEKPVSAGIDPYHKLIDRAPDNNTWKFGSKPPLVNTDVTSNSPGSILIDAESD
ncbi:ABC transporter permease/M1 family aminopeptidase [Taibaiella koreensis]|uniref:ABC transporter permease/M1 family aminopeptidase n=1 Tax=Taibaiella koreensis TaxID=1268548 RepID=UPI000E59ADD7|nr:M1 family aminopeptidase [Taibaiella koreensis]